MKASNLFSLLAQATSADTPVLELPSGDYATTLARMVLSLIAIVLLLFATVWFLKRCIQKRLQKGVGTESIQILEKRMLSPKSMLYLIEVEGEKVVIAESQVEIRRVHSLRGDAVSDETAIS